MLDDTAFLSAFNSLAECGQAITSFPFKTTNALSKAALVDGKGFEALYIRDATAQEISLFTAKEGKEFIIPQDSHWTATTAKPPKRAGLRHTVDLENDPFEEAFELVRVQYSEASNKEIEVLQDQYHDLHSSIAALERSLKLPLQRTAVDTEVERVEKEMSLLADQIKREEMEILALLEIMPERQTEVDELRSQVRRQKMRSMAPPAPAPTDDLAAFAKSGRTATVRTAVTPPAPAPVLFETPAPAPAPSVEEEVVTPRPRAVKAVKEVEKVVRKMKDLPDGITRDDLQKIINLLWGSPLGDILRPYALELLDADELPNIIPLSLTLQTVEVIMNTPAVDPLESSSSSAAPSTSSSLVPIPPNPTTAVEMKLISLLLRTFSTAPTATSFPIISRSTKSTLVKSKLQSYFNLNLLRAELKKFTAEKRFDADLGRSALYALVSKAIIEINREDSLPAVTFII